MNPQIDKLVRRTTMVATVTAAYFLLTADYGSEPNVLDPIKKAIQSAESSMKGFIFGSKSQSKESEREKLSPDSAKKGFIFGSKSQSKESEREKLSPDSAKEHP